MISNGPSHANLATGMRNGYQQHPEPHAVQGIPQHQPHLQHQHAYPGMNSGAQDSDDEGIDLAK
jgi:hypothetical protein